MWFAKERMVRGLIIPISGLGSEGRRDSPGCRTSPLPKEWQGLGRMAARTESLLVCQPGYPGEAQVWLDLGRRRSERGTISPGYLPVGDSGL